MPEKTTSNHLLTWCLFKALHELRHEGWAIDLESIFKDRASCSKQQSQNKFEGVGGDLQKNWDYNENMLS